MNKNFIFEIDCGLSKIINHNLDKYYYFVLKEDKEDTFYKKPKEFCIGFFFKNDYNLFTFTFAPMYGAYEIIRSISPSFGYDYLYFVDRDDFHEYLEKNADEIKNYYLMLS